MGFSPGYPEFYEKGDCTLETIIRDAELDRLYREAWIPDQWWDAHRQADALRPLGLGLDQGEKTMPNELQTTGGGQLPAKAMGALTVQEVVGQVTLVQEVMSHVMKENEHYGVIPGTGSKPSLLKPGAEKLAHTFQLAPRYSVERFDLPGGHREYEVTCELSSITTGHFLGAGVGNASTMEAKYRFRRAEQKCPQCGKTTIIKGKKQYGGGWLCWAKKGGCGAKFPDGDPAIENQDMGRVEHDNPADYYNTVKKMAKKRAFVDAVLTVTAASDIFTQDVEDLKANGTVVDAEFSEAPPKAGQEPPPREPDYYPDMDSAPEPPPEDPSFNRGELTSRGWNRVKKMGLEEQMHKYICDQVQRDLPQDNPLTGLDDQWLQWAWTVIDKRYAKWQAENREAA